MAHHQFSDIRLDTYVEKGCLILRDSIYKQHQGTILVISLSHCLFVFNYKYKLNFRTYFYYVYLQLSTILIDMAHHRFSDIRSNPYVEKGCRSCYRTIFKSSKICDWQIIWNIAFPRECTCKKGMIIILKTYENNKTFYLTHQQGIYNCNYIIV